MFKTWVVKLGGQGWNSVAGGNFGKNMKMSQNPSENNSTYLPNFIFIGQWESEVFKTGGKVRREARGG